MPSTRRATARIWFGRFWRAVDTSRRVLFNLIFLAIVVAVIAAWVRGGGPALQEKTALVLDLHGSLAEQKAGNLRRSALDQVRGDSTDKVQLRDVLAVLDTAASDPKIERLVLMLDEFDGAGMASLHEVAAAIDRFRAAGKPVVAWGSRYDQRQYFLAAHADEVLMHPFGMVYLEGFGRYRNYYRDALDKLGVKVNLIRVGTYKSAAEPFIANGPSPAAREADIALYGDLWAGYTADVEKARRLAPGSIARAIEQLPQRLAAARGDTARLAVTEKLVDDLKTPDELRALLIARGAKDDEGKTFRQVSFGDYLPRVEQRRTGDAVGVVIAEGEIVDDAAPAGTVGGRSTANLIHKAREDKSVKAIVLRVNSPGGSVFGSELVRRELEVARASGKPVVVSMGDLAASGGYWISTPADEIVADRATLTGSIGVFGLLPSADQALEKLGVHTAGVTTTWLGGAGDWRRPLDPRFAAVTQSDIDHAYATFISYVAAARHATPPAIDAVAQGRVWTGAQAKERGLVDRLGSYREALDSAAARAHLAKGYRVAYLEREPGRFARVLELLGASLAQAIGARIEFPADAFGVPVDAAREVAQELGGLTALLRSGRPFGAFVHCLCSAP